MKRSQRNELSIRNKTRHEARFFWVFETSVIPISYDEIPSRIRPYPSIRNFRILVSKPLVLIFTGEYRRVSEITLSLELEKFDTPVLLEIQKLSIIRFNRIRSLKLLKFVVNRI